MWPRLTRPWVLCLAVLVHGGIALAYGMITFGLAMLIGNLAFVSPQTVRRWVDPITRRIALVFADGGAGQGGGAPARYSRPALVNRRGRFYTGPPVGGPPDREPIASVAV